MDKNIVALIREDTKTVNVRFFPQKFAAIERYVDAVLIDLGDLKVYKYVTTLDLAPGDLCMVYVGNYPAIVEVQSVDETLEIEPDAEKQYHWIAAKIDMSYFKKTADQNKELSDTLDEAYRTNTRKSFRNMLLQSLDLEHQAKLIAITKGM